MIEFDQLPQTSRSLILATLALDIASVNCRNIFDLAIKRNQTIQDVWRDICRRTAQPRCTMPRPVMDSRYTAAEGFFASPHEAAVAPAATAPGAPHISPLASPSPSVGAQLALHFGDVIAVTANSPAIGAPVTVAAPATKPAPMTKATPAARPHRVAARRAHRGPNAAFKVAASLGVVLVLGIGLVIVLASSHPTQIVTDRFDGGIRVGRTTDAVRTGDVRSVGTSVPAPEGTVRRMDAISRAFSKQ